MNRRRLLAVAASAGVGVTAGCLSDGNDYATLQSMNFVNSNDNPVTIDFRIERADTDEVVHAEARNLSTDPAATVADCTWPDAPLTVSVRHVDGDWDSVTTADETGCMGILVNIHGQRTAFYTHHSECPIRNPSCHADATE